MLLVMRFGFCRKSDTTINPIKYKTYKYLINQALTTIEAAMIQLGKILIQALYIYFFKIRIL